MNENPKILIDQFRGRFRFLSNFYEAMVVYEGIEYNSVEAAFQAAKTLDVKLREKIATMTPSEAKRAGRSLSLRADWEEIKVQVMRDLLWQKFYEREENDHLTDLLLSTKSARLVEGNSWRDHFWGVCNDQGSNWLGILLMEVREDIQRRHGAFQGEDMPGVGVAVIVLNPENCNEVLISRRIKGHGKGQLCLPGGKLRKWETIAEATIREVEEETGLVTSYEGILHTYESFFQEEEMHFITMLTFANVVGGRLMNKEPKKKESWWWQDWSSPIPEEPHFAFSINRAMDMFQAQRAIL